MSVGGSSGAIISVLIVSVICGAELSVGGASEKVSGIGANSAGDIFDSSGPTGGKFDRPQITACHT